jgi:hypothetical protein
MATASTRPKGTKINLDKCWNTEDPITLEDLTDKSVDETIMIPSSHEKKKNHCFLVESLFGWYSKNPYGPIKNPLDPSRILTDAEINELLDKMAKINAKMVTNLDKFNFTHQKIWLRTPNGEMEFYRLFLRHKGGKNNDKIYDDLGVIPAFDPSSNTIINKLDELWATNRLMWPDTELCCRVQLKFKVKDWFNAQRTFDKELLRALDRDINKHLAE